VRAVLSSPWIQDLVARLAQWVPVEVARLVIALAVVAVGYVLARVIKYVVVRLFRRASAQLSSMSRRASRRAGLPETPEARERAEVAAIEISGRVAFWLVFALFLGVATTVLGFPALSAWLESLAGYLPRVMASAAIVLLGILSGVFARVVVTAAAGSSGFAVASSLGRAAQVAVVGLAAAVAIEELGIEITFLVVVAAVVLGATLGAAALAFGLGARTSVSNLLASHYLAKWYRVGQMVRVGEHEGRIVEILPGAVVLHTKSGRLYVPAQRFAEQPSLRVADEGGE